MAFMPALAQDLFKSTAPDGRTVYSDRPPTEGKLEKTIKVESLPSSALPESAFSYVEQLRKFRANSPAKQPERGASDGIVLYSAKWCRYCRQAKAYLAAKSIAYQEIDIDTKAGLEAFAVAGGGKGIPLLVSGSSRVRGFTAAAYDGLFAKAK